MLIPRKNRRRAHTLENSTGAVSGVVGETLESRQLLSGNPLLVDCGGTIQGYVTSSLPEIPTEQVDLFFRELADPSRPAGTGMPGQHAWTAFRTRD